MTTYPLQTLAVTVTPTGITAPSYADILLSLQASYKSIYGADCDLDPDTQDGAWLAIQAAAINDTNATAIAVYNSFSPSTAQGAGLSSVVKVNGITRLVPSNSSAVVTIVGQAGTTITNGVVGDDQNLGTRWDLPTTVNIPTGGSITETAICETPGAVTATPGTLTKILTPTAGWQTVTNAADAAVGAPVETDAQLRARQTTSTALPSETVLAGIVGAISNLTGVTAVKPYENDTSTTDGNGLPGHSLAMVVEGGDAQSIVNIIGEKKTIGCNTYGTSSGTYVDPNYGFAYTIHWSVPVHDRIIVVITGTALTGYTSAVGIEIQNAVAAYVNSLGIGQNVILTRIYAPALLQGPYAKIIDPNDPFTYELTSILIAVYPGSPGSSDLTTGFNHIPTCSPLDVTVTIT